jgi:hypothetical protein
MHRLRIACAGMLLGLVASRSVAGDALVPTARLDTALGPSVALAYVGEPRSHGWFDLTPGLVIDSAVGLAGARLAVGPGYGGRDGGEPGTLALKGSVLYNWSSTRLQPQRATFAGAELEVVFKYGMAIGLLKRVDGPGWKATATLVRAF